MSFVEGGEGVYFEGRIYDGDQLIGVYSEPVAPGVYDLAEFIDPGSESEN